MKIISLIASVICLTLAACNSTGTTKTNIGVEVKNRDAHGHFILPACPSCGTAPNMVTVLYQCPNGHVFHGPISAKK